MGVASTLYFITNYVVNKGFVIVQRNQQTTYYHHRKPSWKSFLSTLKAMFSTPSRLARIAQANVQTHGFNPLLFTIFIIGFWIITSYDSTKDTMQIASFYTLLQGIGLALCVLTMALSSAKHKPYYSLLWFLTVGYCIPYATTLTCLADIKELI